MRTTKRVLLTSCTLLVSACATQVRTLRSDSESDRLSRLEQRVEDLETVAPSGVDDAPLSKPTVSRPSPTGKAAWRELQVGMTQTDVRALLGEPLAIEVKKNTGTIEWCYAAENCYSGSVTFDYGTKLLQGWIEPR